MTISKLLHRLLIIPAIIAGGFSSGNSAGKMNESSVLDFSMKNIDGTVIPLANYKGKVILIVNVASRCGYTPQYEGLETLYEKYKGKGFVILGFPANNFLGQEPGTDEEIKAFCSTKYNVSFDIFSKISVRGNDKSPLYKFLTSKETNPGFDGEIEWNFQKFLVGRDGKVIARFSPGAKPLSDEIVKAVEKALGN
jgi:glutathione peroxidase